MGIGKSIAAPRLSLLDAPTPGRRALQGAWSRRVRTAENCVYFRGGAIRFGKLYMVLADLLAIDTDPSHPFHFYLDYYHTQLVAGYHVTLPNYRLVAYMPDFDDLGRPEPPQPPVQR